MPHVAALWYNDALVFLLYYLHGEYFSLGFVLRGGVN